MSILGIELRRSSAIWAALILLLAAVGVFYAVPQNWVASYMSLAMYERQTLGLLWPLAMAAGAWQGRREHKAKVAELFDSTPRPRREQVVPILGATALTVGGAYLVAAAAAAPRIIDTASYLPAQVFAVLAVGAISLVAAVWVGVAVGRLVPLLVTPPILAILVWALSPALVGALKNQKWLAMLFLPFNGVGSYTDYQTVEGRVSFAQAVWLIGLAAAGAVLLAAASRRTRVWAAVVAVAGASAGVALMPSGAAFHENPVDPVAMEQVCAAGSPRVCVARVHKTQLPEVIPYATRGLAVLAKVPGGPTNAREEISVYFGEEPPPPPADTAVFPVQLDADGHVQGSDGTVREMVIRTLRNDFECSDSDPGSYVRAATAYLLGAEPVKEYDSEPAEVNAEAVTIWQGLRKMPEQAALNRIGDVRKAARACQPLDKILAGKSS